MGKKDKNKKKGKGAEKTAMKTDKKMAAKQKKMIQKLGEAAIEDIISNLEAEEARLKTVTETICNCPTPRSNFSIIPHPDKEELIIFGGELFNGQKVCIYNDLFFYNIGKNEWKQIKSPSGPAPRSGHQMCSISKDGGQLWLFGGEHASPSQLQFYHYKDLWVFGLTTKKWDKINAPNGPSPRSGHRMVALKKKLVVFGGFHDNNQSYKYFNDIHMFSLESYDWMKITLTDSIIPAPRSGCCMAPSNTDGRIYIWGGYSKSAVKKDIDRGVTHTDMFVLIPDKTSPNEKFKWQSVKPGGYKPLPRSSVGTACAASGKVYCFGGVMDIEEDEEDVCGQFGNELYSFDLNSTTWRLLEIYKKEKSVKSGQSTDREMKEVVPIPNATTTTAIDNIFKITFGGGTSTSSNNKKTEKSKAISEPSCRMNPGLCVVKGSLYVYGGIYEENSKQYTYNDLYSLDVSKLNEWKTIIPNNLVHDWIDESDDSSSGSDDSESDNDTDGSSASEMDTD